MIKKLLFLAVLIIPSTLGHSYIAIDKPEPVIFDLDKLMYIEESKWILN
jgi:hypothetical protein